MSDAGGTWRVHKVTMTDLVEVIAAGVRDFRKAPRYGVFFGALYAVAGWLLLALLLRFGMPYFAYPLAMGFALIAPFAVVGLYTVSDNIERGIENTWAGIFGSIRGAIKRDVRWMALITGFALIIWMDIAAFLMFAFVGVQGVTPDTLNSLLTTPSGLLFLILGNVVGAVIAFFVFSISVVSFPLLHDRDVDFVTAMVTSVRLVIENPRTMLIWCAIIGVLTGISLLSVFLGLVIVLPVVGHATWHLYRRAVEFVPGGRPAPATAETGLKTRSE